MGRAMDSTSLVGIWDHTAIAHPGHEPAHAAIGVGLGFGMGFGMGSGTGTTAPEDVITLVIQLELPEGFVTVSV